MPSIAEKCKDAKYFKVCLAAPRQHIFLATIWLFHGQLWAILEGTAALTRYLLLRFPKFRPEGHQ